MADDGKPADMAADRDLRKILDEVDLDALIGMTAARLMRGRGGRAPSVETVRRWAGPKRGCYPQGRQGPQLVLMTIRMNGELLTLPEWVEAFEEARFRLGAAGG